MRRVHDRNRSRRESGDAPDDRAWRRPDHDRAAVTLDGAANADTTPRSVVMLVTDGVLLDEAATYREILGRWPSARLVVAAPRAGQVMGVGGQVVADAALSDLDRCDVLVVPGAIGSEVAGGDERVARPVAVLARTASWILASSTGTLLLARAGVPLGDTASTHWLASDRLRAYGVASADGATCVRGKVVTAQGRVGAHNSALTLTAQVYGAAQADAIAASLVRPTSVPPRRRRRWSCRWRAVGRRHRIG